jgi:hypothetical protein
MERTCGQCGLKALKGGMCPIFNSVMPDDGPGCPYYSAEVKTCDICGQLILMNAVIDTEHGDPHIMCSNCANADPCVTCRQRQQCAFQFDTSCPEPQVVNVQMRQGNMVMQTQKINPKRVEATCAHGCMCFREEGLTDGDHCIKQLGCGCPNYNPNWRN